MMAKAHFTNLDASVPESRSQPADRLALSAMRVSIRQSVRGVIQGMGSLGLSLGGLLAVSTPPSLAAEDIRVLYGPIQVTISVDSLETFANEGIVKPDLEAYTKRLSDDELASVRKTLQSSVDIEQVALSNFLYTTQGEAILDRLGSVIRTRSNSGFYALRAALILAAGEEGGATPIDVLKAFPTQSIVIDVDRGLQIVRELDQLTNATSEALSLIEAQFSKGVGAVANSDFDQTYPPNQTGPYLWDATTLTLDDAARDRTFDVDVYVPNTDAPAPLVVISHGLGSDRTSYRYLASHLASHGFAVASPDHPGSNADYVQALFEGASNQISEPGEFINRSEDIRFLLDELERRVGGDLALGDRLDTENVAVIGQSFGGYTALSLGGAAINFDRLAADCDDDDRRDDTLNLSLLLQCRAASLNLEEQIASDLLSLRDDRIKAVMAINPIGSTVFGREGFSQVEVPTLIMTSSADVVAPTLFEQIFPFSWLNVSRKYLVLMRGATHFSTIGPSSVPGADVSLPEPIVGPSPELAQQYTQTISTAFLETHLRGDESYQRYLSPTYISSLSRQPLPLSIVESINAERITQLVKDASLIASATE
ncbi:MAG: alpha/beta fold hydrolase [Leptolyngbyaceae bacterium]|nr:alpha/beta fold hydrolase [Leptolyngbyaceae bacterium]